MIKKASIISLIFGSGFLISSCDAHPKQQAANEINIQEVEVHTGHYYVGPILGMQAYQANSNTKVSGFYVMKTEVTCGLYSKIKELSARYGYVLAPLECPLDANAETDFLPVRSASWWDAIVFANALSAISNEERVYLDSEGREIKSSRHLTANTFIQLNVNVSGYRLPSADEWQIAARGGQSALRRNSYGSSFSGGNRQDEVAWFTEDVKTMVHAVATKHANELGIYDMSGNVSEWTDSAYSLDLDQNNQRYLMYFYCGGSVLENERLNACDTHSPNYRSSDLGFRLVRTMPLTSASNPWFP